MSCLIAPFGGEMYSWYELHKPYRGDSMLSITSVLALFTLLSIASAVFFIAKKIKIPYTVLLVIVGLAIIPLSQLPFLEPTFGFLDDIVLTPELLFFIFLPILIFESAFNMNIRRMLESAWSITSLAVVGLLISTFVIATALYFIFPLVGLNIPFIVTLLFGAIISSTDPVAVLALFKDYGAPKRLSLIFEGESLFNDGTAVALFLIILSIAQTEFNGFETVVGGIGMFTMMVVSGIIIGLVMASIFSRALRFTKSNEFVSVTLLIISAHLVFVVSELINEYGVFGFELHVSSIIATTVAALFLGNYARHILSPRTDLYLEKSVEHLAFVANSLVFILAGMLFASTKVDLTTLWIPILVTIVVVAIARIIAVYLVTVPLNILKLEAAIPSSWQKLLAWGSLRGALAIIIVMLIPDDLAISGWEYAYSLKEFVLALTIGCILATLFVKALTIKTLINRYKLNVPTIIDQAHEADLGIYYLMTEQSRFDTQKTRGFVRETEYDILHKKLVTREKEAYQKRNDLRHEHGIRVFEQSLHLSAIDIEEHYLKELYINEEVSERVYRIIKGKLQLQKEKIEHAQHDDINPSLYTDRKDVFDRLVAFIQAPFERKSIAKNSIEQLQYYRAQMIIARKALKTLDEMQTKYKRAVFLPEAYGKVVDRYSKYKEQSSIKVDAVLQSETPEIAVYMRQLAEKSLRSSGRRAISYLQSRGISNEAVSHDIESHYSVQSL
jgi:CPA1 family monovalent cation:H+ antiporter